MHFLLSASVGLIERYDCTSMRLSLCGCLCLCLCTETWLSAQGDEAKTAELAPSGFDVKSFPRQSRSRGGGIATVYKSTLGSCITFKTNFDFTHTSFEVVQASITLQHNTLHFFCLYRPPPNRRNNLTDSMFTEQLPDLLD